MAKVLKIAQEGKPVLRKKAEPVKEPKSPEIKRLVSDMIATMKTANGIGLAAPQVGISLRLFTTNIENKVCVFINPEIKDIFGFSYEDFVLENYDPHPPIKAPIAV